MVSSTYIMQLVAVVKNLKRPLTHLRVTPCLDHTTVWVTNIKMCPSTMPWGTPQLVTQLR